MATIGNTAKPTAGQEWWGLNAKNQHSILITMPSNGTITSLSAWLAGKDTTASVALCVWSAGGTLLASTSTFTAASRSFALGQSDLYTAGLSSPLAVTAGTQYFIGFSRNPSQSVQFGTNGSGTHYDSTQASWPGSLASNASHAGSIGVYATYSTNAVPNAPTLNHPVGGYRTTLLNETLIFTHSDPNGDACASYDLQVSSEPTFSIPANMFWDISDQTTGISGNTISRAYGGSTLVRGISFYWRARTNDGTGDGAWSSTGSFIVNQLPSASKTSPASSNFAFIHNLASDTSAWTLGGSHAKPRFSWTFSDADGDAQSAYRVRIYSASAGGTLLHDSGQVSSSLKTYDSSFAGVMGTEYWWTIEVWDALNDTSGESSRTAFKMRWAQAIYEYAVTGGTSSSQWSFASSGVGANTQASFLYATATGASGAGRSSWKTDIGELTPNAYLNVMVRLASNSVGTNPTLGSMTFNYTASGVIPQQWDFFPSGAWILDASLRRYGTRSLHCTRVDAISEHYIFPLQSLNLSPNTTYTASAYVRTNGVLSSPVYLYVTASGAELLDGSDADKTAARTDDSSGGADGWQRIIGTFTTGNDLANISIKLIQQPGLTGEQFWVDAVQIEEGAVASAWKPGMIGEAAALDVSGLMIDGTNGGILSLRGSAGGSTDIVELGSHGLSLGGGHEFYVYDTGVVTAGSTHFIDASAIPQIAAGMAASNGNNGLAMLSWYRNGTFNGVLGMQTGDAGGARFEFRESNFSAGAVGWSFYIESNLVNARLAVKNNLGFDSSLRIYIFG